MCNTERAQRIRRWAQGNWSAQPWPAGTLVYNTHHALYQAALTKTGKFFVVDPMFVEWSDAQLALWLERVRDMRQMAAKALEREK